MSEQQEILTAIKELKKEVNQNFNAVNELKKEVNLGFKSVNKRLDGIENELRKIDTVLGYSEQYNNIPT